MIPHLRDWDRESDLTASHLQEPVVALRSLDSQVESIVAGLLGERWAYFETWIGEVVAAGPSAEADWSDERYWVKKRYAKGGLQRDNLDLADDISDRQEGGGSNPYIYTASNLRELVRGTHFADTNTHEPVYVHAFFDRGNPNTKRYFFECAVATQLVVGLAMDGGSDGGPGVGVSWTYTATTFGGTVLATGLTPDQRILPETYTTQATIGLAYRDGSGDWKLFSTNEQPSSHECGT